MVRGKVFWDVVMVLACLGIAYGAWQMIAAKGWFLGAVMALAAVIFGAYAFQVIYPLWFRD